MVMKPDSMPMTKVRLAADSMANLSDSKNEWVPLVRSMNEDEDFFGWTDPGKEGAWYMDRTKASDNISHWLEEGDLDTRKASQFSAQIDDSAIARYYCSSCGNPSPTLMKCSGCSGAKYCDVIW
jgi:hypothetical protein